MISNKQLRVFIAMVAVLAQSNPDILDFFKDTDVKELIKAEMKKLESFR